MLIEKTGTLTLVGSGINFFAHLSPESRAYIENADKVLYLVNDPVAKDWFKKSIHNAESLDSLYVKHDKRGDNYQAIADYILKVLRQGVHLTVVLYGHPTIFAEPGLMAFKQAIKEGFDAKILPGISAEDCLFADLAIDPSSSGCQSFEASDFIVYERPFNTVSHLILWQVGFIGALGHIQAHDNTVGINLLTNYLLNQYPSDHEIALYEAAQYARLTPRIDRLALKNLPIAKTSPLTTLYVPPATKAEFNQSTLDALGIRL